VRVAGQFCTCVIKAPNMAHIQPNMLQTLLESHCWSAPTPHWPTNSKISYYERLFSLTTRINLGLSATKIRSRIENDRKKFQFFIIKLGPEACKLPKTWSIRQHSTSMRGHISASGLIFLCRFLFDYEFW